MTRDAISNFELKALAKAAEHPNGWAETHLSVVLKLAERGFFEQVEDVDFGLKWRITEAGRRALANAR